MCPSGGGVSEPGFSSGGCSNNNPTYVLANFDFGSNNEQTLCSGEVFHRLTPVPLAASAPVRVNELPASSSFATNVSTGLSVDYTVAEIEKCHLIDTDSQPLLKHNQNSQAAAESNEKDEVHNSRFRNHVYQVLMETGEGELLIQLYDFEQDKENLKELIESKKRTFFSIHKVARILVHHEIRRTRCYTIHPERFEALAQSAVQLFPSYLKESFYTRPTANSNAHGVLQGYYEGVREKAIAIKLIQPTRSQKRNREEEKSFSDALEDLKEPVSIIDDEYRRKWGRTATHEKIEFFKSCDIRTALSTFPNLANPAGYTLIQEDFCAFFNKPIDLFARNWPQIACKILKFAKTKTSDKAIKQILQSNEPIVAEDKIQIVALILLPYLFKKIVKQTVRSKGGKNWYPEKHQVLDTFILQIKETEHFGEALQAAQTRLKELHTDHVLTVQPYVVISGVSLEAITSAYVVIDNYTYQVVSPVQAVDICFQFVKVLHDKFSHISKHVWQFFEREVYGFPVPDLYKGVSELIENLRKF